MNLQNTFYRTKIDLGIVILLRMPYFCDCVYIKNTLVKNLQRDFCIERTDLAGAIGRAGKQNT